MKRGCASACALCLSGMVGTRRNTQVSTSDSSTMVDKYPNLSNDGKLFVTIMLEELTKLPYEIQIDFQQMMNLKKEQIEQLKVRIHFLHENIAKMKENIDEVLLLRATDYAPWLGRKACR